MSSDHNDRPHALSAALILSALGVVYGDIGTSPLYAFKESIGGEGGAGVSQASVLGVLSMIFWAITLVVSIKYVMIVLRASNDGEGGILALLALVLRQLPAEGRYTGAAVALGLFGAAMFYGDSVITPAISVLSAVEGLEVVSPQLTSWVIPLTLDDPGGAVRSPAHRHRPRRQRLRARSCCCGSCRSASWAPCRSPAIRVCWPPCHRCMPPASSLRTRPRR